MWSGLGAARAILVKAVWGEQVKMSTDGTQQTVTTWWVRMNGREGSLAMVPMTLEKAHSLQPGGHRTTSEGLWQLCSCCQWGWVGCIIYTMNIRPSLPLVLSPQALHCKPMHPSDIGSFDSSRRPSTPDQARPLWDRQTYLFVASFGCIPTLGCLTD